MIFESEDNELHVIAILGMVYLFGVVFIILFIYFINYTHRMYNLLAYNKAVSQNNINKAYNKAVCNITTAKKKRKKNNNKKTNQRKKKRRKKERPRVTTKYVFSYERPHYYHKRKFRPKKKKKKKKSHQRPLSDATHFNPNCRCYWQRPVKCIQCNNDKCCPDCYAVDINWQTCRGKRKFVCRKCIKTFEQSRMYTSIKRYCDILTNQSQIIKTIVDYSTGYVHKCDNKNCNFELFLPTSFEAKSNSYRVYKCCKLTCSRTYCQLCYQRSMLSTGRCNTCINKNEFIEFKDVFMDIKWISDLIRQIGNEMNITKIIFEYWIGCVLHCTNGIKCNKEITIEHQSHFKGIFASYSRHNANVVGKFCYEIDEKYANQQHHKYLVKVYGKYIRVLCNDCVQAQNCGVCNMCRCNSDPQFNPCLNHPSCKICKKRRYPGYDHFTGLHECYNCNGRYCVECGLTRKRKGKKQYLCKTCIINEEHTIINKAILNGVNCNLYLRDNLDINIVVLIAQYSYGIVMDCMTVQCNHEIAMDSIFELKKQYKYVYKIQRNWKRQVHNLDTVLLFGQNRRIFCKTCVETKRVIKCKLCKNYDEDNICGVHKICGLCYEPINRNSLECVLCKKEFCNRCKFGNEIETCLKCGNKELLYTLLQPYIVYEEIIDILIEYMDYDIGITIHKQQPIHNAQPKRKRKRKKRKYDYYKQNNNLSDSRYSPVLMNENLMDYGYIQQFYGRI